MKTKSAEETTCQSLRKRQARSNRNPMNETTPIVPEELHSQLVAVEHYVTAAEAANFLSINRLTLMRMARAGAVPAHPLGNGLRRVWRFLLSELDWWMRNRVNSPCRPCSPNRREI